MKRFLCAALCLLAAACAGTRKLADPVLEIRGPEQSELGVATDYGLVFLGRSARAGAVDVIAWFGDGPSIEQAVVEPLGGGLFTAEPEIKLPRVPLSFDAPRLGEKLFIVGRRGPELWAAQVEVRRDPQVEGVLLTIPKGLENGPDQIGAGLYRVNPNNAAQKQLVGLVSGRVEVTGSDGTPRAYLTAVGPDQLWRLVTYKRDYPHKRKFVYREDVL